MKNLLMVAALAAVATAAVAAEKKPAIGIEESSLDRSVNPCDDFFRFAAGGWIAKNPIPGDYAKWGVWNSIEVRNFEVLRKIMEDAAKAGAKAGQNQKLIGAFWKTGMDTAALEAEGLKGIQPELDRIAAVKDVDGLVDAIARHHRLGLTALYRFASTQDYKDSSQVIGGAEQGGLGLPEREYYLKDDEAARKLRGQYLEYVATMLSMLGEGDAAKAEAQKIMDLETRLAKASMTNVDRRDPVKTYHKMSADEFAKLAPKLGGKRYLAAAGKKDVKSVNVEHPPFMQEGEKMLAEVPLDAWKAYLRFHLADAMAPYMADRFVDAQFAFRGKTLTGKKELLPRFKRVINAAGQLIGEAVGERYVKEMFPPRAKKKAIEMINKMRATLKEELAKVDWMAPETRKKAQAKLAAFRQKIGYPDRWRDYSRLELSGTSYAANVLRCREFEHQRDLAKIGKPVDRNEWYMPPQMINAYYDPSNNEIAFPAGILQPPMFHPDADDALNLGAIGAIIGHEMGHGFDDQGAQFDARGNLANWWTESDLKSFQARTDCVAKQFDTYGIEGGLMTKGKLVVGEAVGDLNGLNLAYRTLVRGLEGKKVQKDAQGWTPQQRFFLAFGQGWGQHARIEMERLLIQTDPHPLARFRVNGTVTNMPEFHEAFGCKDGKLVRATGEACKIW